MSFEINYIHVFAAVDEQGNEGVIGMQTKEGWIPFVAADSARLSDLIPIAESIAKQSKKHVRLLRFSDREEVGLIEPGQKLIVERNKEA